MIFETISSLFSFPWVIVNTLIGLVVYQCFIRYWDYFQRQNVKFIRGLPFIGAQYKVLLGFQSLSDGFRELYRRFPGERFVGIYELGGRPVYMIRDPELIKKISIRDFDHFVNHMTDVHEKSDPLLGKTMFIMRDQRWKDMRSTLSPAFTGSKMRLMFGLIVGVADRFCEHLRSQTTAKTTTMFELKNLFTRFTSDVIASCAFGIDTESIKDKNNEFYRTGETISQFGLILFGYNTIPAIMNFLKVRVINDRDTTFFRKLVKENIAYREKHKIVRNDMIDLLIEAKKGNLKYVSDESDDNVGFATVEESVHGRGDVKKWDDDDLASQCILFFLAGFNGVAMFLCFVTHALAIHPDVQVRLHQEIQDVEKTLNGKPVTYDIIQRMKYLDMVISETLRMWPLAPAGDRVCNKPYVMENYNGDKVQVNVGDGIWLPTSGIHHDPQYFPEPEKFDPERFNDDNKHNISADVYTPFGTGPRNCIGNRFALMEGKAIIYRLVSEFEIERCARTQHPLKLKAATINVEAKNGFWVAIKSRN